MTGQRESRVEEVKILGQVERCLFVCSIAHADIKITNNQTQA